MHCPHCGIAFHVNWKTAPIREPTDDDQTAWMAAVTRCPECEREAIRLLQLGAGYRKNPKIGPLLDFMAYPKATNRKLTPKEVPDGIKRDYEEACRVLSDSNKASAALSRRCLQAILRGQGYNQRDLVQQIDALLKEQDPKKAIPMALHQTMDAIRNFGNFSAHPVTDQTTLQIIEVEQGEAE